MARLTYFTRETLISLRRNLMMTFAGVITVAISLSLFGGILLVSSVVDHGTEKWKHGVELEVFMKTDATQAQVNQMSDALHHDPMVKSFRFLDHNAAFGEFKKDFSDQPALVESTPPSALPESFRVVPVKAEYTDQIQVAYQDQLGVDVVITAQQQVKKLLTFTRWIRIFFFVISVSLLLSSLFLIVNTIRLATFARRREIEVMKLVGASNWFVRIPFMAEGLVQGIIGAGLAIGVVAALKVGFDHWFANDTGFFRTFYVTTWDATFIAIIVLALGVVIGLIGSAIGLGRFLRV